jgi:cytidine deaminase
MSGTPDDFLIAAARDCLGTFTLSTAELTAGSVAAALETATGRIHTGICLDLACGIGFCAEHAAIAAMLLTRETTIRRIVAVSASGILAPCGRCREMMAQVDARNLDCIVLLAGGQSRSLRTLLPEHWLAGAPSPSRA